ncbi:MAG TPA: hypothetical protein VN939_04395 [Chthoniobacterales bacterium]|jgi:hypothetical protein|nr:hypothetical protein [Chthoniobacterales bacterium]
MKPFDRSRLRPETLKELGENLNRDEILALKKLQNSDERWATAVHEGAHYYYRTLVGDEPFFMGPYFSYFGNGGDVSVNVGGVTSKSVKKFKVIEMARWNVAGYLWEDKLCPESSKGTEGARADKDTFFEFVRLGNPTAHDNQIQAYWDAAEVEVRSELEDATIEAGIRHHAKEFEKFVLPWIEP